jgi:hypothetical protein
MTDLLLKMKRGFNPSFFLSILHCKKNTTNDNMSNSFWCQKKKIKKIWGWEKMLFVWFNKGCLPVICEVESCLTFSVDGIQKNVDNYVENF